MTFINNQKSRFLIVDDDQQLADTIVRYIKQLGYHADAAYCGKDGLMMFRQKYFQVVIIDLKMPDMDGIEFLETIKSVDKHVVGVVITGHGTIKSAVQAIKKGAYDYITKPFEKKELEMVVRRAREKHSLLKQLGVFRGLTLALVISIPFWLILGIILANRIWN